MSKIHNSIKKSDTVQFNNNATFCVGTGRMGLALRHEYHDQLKKVQEDINFSHIRGHGLFCDDMAIYQAYEEDGVEKVEYNFTYVDMVFDDYLSMGIKPFIELGFMPKKLASGDQTIFYWKGNTTPPKDYDQWAALIKATINHWFERYGKEEVITWPFEVWNEPNLPGFWKGADMKEYFKLYDVSSRAVKDCDSRIRVGGPAICGVDDVRWLKEFLEYCKESNTPIDFVTRHAYATEQPDRIGHYAYQQLRTPEHLLEELQVSRDIIDSFPEYKGMEMHITEFNTSYTPLNPIHDTNLNAAYIARLLSEMGDTCASYSYWTFGDVFEESGVAFSPFSGGFGLLANGSIPKPTYWTFEFFSKLGKRALAREDNYIVTAKDQDNYVGIAWNPVEEEVESNISISLDMEVDNGEYVLITKMVDEVNCNPLQAWINLGSPKTPTKEQNQLLQNIAMPRIETKNMIVKDNKVELSIELSANALQYFELKKIQSQVDRGFQKERVRGAVRHDK